MIGCTVSKFDIFYFELLDPELSSAASLSLRPSKFLQSSASNLRTYRVIVLIIVFFELLYVYKLREATRMRVLWLFTQKDRKIGRAASSFEIFYFKRLDPEILSSASSILRLSKFLQSSTNNLRTYRVVISKYVSRDAGS